MPPISSPVSAGDNKAELAYMAGLFDGEGSFSFATNMSEGRQGKTVRFMPATSLLLRYGSDVLLLFRHRFGGCLHKDRHGMTHWTLNRREAVRQVAICLQPWLRIKRWQCGLFLAGLDLLPGRPAKGSGICYKHGQRSLTRENALRLAEIASTINPSTRFKRSAWVRANIDLFYPLEVRCA